VTSDDRISAFFGYRLARPFLLSINRDDFGKGRLQFSASCRDIKRVAARTNNHDQLVSCDEKWIFFGDKKPRSFLHVTHYLKVTALVNGFELPSVKRITFSTAERYAATAWNSRSVEAWSCRPAMIMRRRTIRSSPDIFCTAAWLIACFRVMTGFSGNSLPNFTSKAATR
jgi:hypothetical protein